jgi:hypothetical protein
MIVHSSDKPVNDVTHSQCRLRHSDGRVTVGWIPTKCAVIGKVLGIEKEKGVWDDGWVVESAGEPKPTDLVRACERNYRDFSYGREHTHQ